MLGTGWNQACSSIHWFVSDIYSSNCPERKIWVLHLVEVKKCLLSSRSLKSRFFLKVERDIWHSCCFIHALSWWLVRGRKKCNCYFSSYLLETSSSCVSQTVSYEQCSVAEEFVPLHQHRPALFPAVSSPSVSVLIWWQVKMCRERNSHCWPCRQPMQTAWLWWRSLFCSWTIFIQLRNDESCLACVT